MTKPNPYYELVKNEGRKKEQILCISSDRYFLNELKVECIKNRILEIYHVRPQAVKTNLRNINKSQP
jgi:wobble nucleotide-excising tRNase